MNRRDFALALAATTTGGLAALPAWAQGEPAEGREYKRMDRPQPVQVPAGKIEVVEFFGYWCPHCSAFEPTLDAWARKLPPDVVLRRIPVAFNEAHKPYQRLYYALEVLGQLDAMHAKVFIAVHQQRLRLEKDSEVAAMASANGLDGAKLVETMKSFSVATKCNQARKAAEDWAINSVPTMGVQGRYITSVADAGGHEKAIRVMEALIQRSRKG